MAKFDKKFESKRQDWTTPDCLWEPLHAEFNFNWDLAADSNNTRCPNYYTEKDNALTREWAGTCWLNPPYGGQGENSLKNWIEYSYTQSLNGSTIVVLTPARTNTNWWHDYCMKAYEIKFIKGRPKFGGAKYGLPQPLAIVVFKEHSRDYPLLTTFEFDQ